MDGCLYINGKMRIKIGNKYWNLIFTELDEETGGECDSPDTNGKEIRIATDLKKQDELEIIIHELLHAADWSKDEEWVEVIADDIARVLSKLGWKKESK
jgi:hypothetical protein